MKRSRLKHIRVVGLAMLMTLAVFGCQAAPNTPTNTPMQDNETEEIDMDIETSETAVPEVKIFFVGPEKADCVGVGPMECYLVKETPNGEWQFFYDQIEGFEWEPGYTYELQLAVHQVENPPADASSLRYELIKVINKLETPVESPHLDAYIRIDDPAIGDQFDTGNQIIISGMGAGLFEGSVVVQILDSEGAELALQATTIQSPEAGLGGEGPWEIEFSISVQAPTDVKIVAFSPSPKDGQGWIASDEISVTLSPAAAAENTSLENTPWLLRTFSQHEEHDLLLAANQVTAFFLPTDTTIRGMAACNRYFSTYTQDGYQISVDNPVATTRRACQEPILALEKAYLSALEEITSYEIRQNELVLKDGKGNQLLVFMVDPEIIE